MMIRVSIASPQEIVPVDRVRMRQVVREVLAGEGVADAEISLAFVDDRTSQTLNNRYLQHDEPTDVLTFPLSDRPERLVGEIVIGAEVAQRQADAREHEVGAELALYVIHGLLHLCDYNDKTSVESAEMRQRERHYLKRLSLPDISPSDQ